MDLFFANVGSCPDGSVSAGDGGQGCPAAKERPSEPPPGRGETFAESLARCCRGPDRAVAIASAQAEHLPVTPQTAGTAPLAPAFLIESAGQVTEDLGEGLPPEEGLLALLGSGGAEPLSEEPLAREVGRGRAPLQTGEPGAGMRPGPPTQNTLRSPSEPTAGQKEIFGLLGPRDGDLEITDRRIAANSYLSNLTAKAGQSLAGTDNLPAPEVQGEMRQRALPSDAEGKGSRGEPQEPPPRIPPPPVQASKGTEPFDPHLGAPRAVPYEGPAEAASPWTGREGAPLRQEIPIEAPSSPPSPAPPSSSQALFSPPLHTHAKGGFHVLENTVHMRIHDEELGPMRWHVRLNGDKITAEAVVETTRVQELLRCHQDVLQAKLNAIGVEVEDFDVFVDAGSQRFSGFFERRAAPHTLRAAEETLCPGGVEPPVTGAGTAAQDRGLDLYV